MSEQSLQPLEQKDVLFYEDEITIVRLSDGTVYIPIRPICEYLGLDWSAQRKRIVGDVVMNEASRSVAVIATEAGGRRDMLCLPLKYLPGWLFGVNVKRIKSELKEKIIRYQRECFDVLAEAFADGRLTTDASFDKLLQTDSDAVQAYQMLQAMVKLARNQILIEARLDEHDGRFNDHTQRLENLEAQFGDETRTISEDQASQISQAVKGIALVMSKRSGRNEYGAVYGEFYRKFGITSYKLLPNGRFAEAMAFLTNWHQELVGDAPF